jgi:hypothetical protein
VCIASILLICDISIGVVCYQLITLNVVSIESLGAVPPDALFVESIRVMKGKCRKFLSEINKGFGEV